MTTYTQWLEQRETELINRAMEAMGVEEGYVVLGGKIVKAGDE